MGLAPQCHLAGPFQAITFRALVHPLDISDNLHAPYSAYGEGHTPAESFIGPVVQLVCANEWTDIVGHC